MGSDTLPSTIVDEIDRARNDFESAWRQGLRPRIEGYLAGRPDTYRSALLHAILTAELEFRTTLGECPALGEYVERFPGDSDTLQALFDGRSTTQPVGATRVKPNPSDESESTTSFFRDGPESLPTVESRAGAARDQGLNDHMPDRIGRYDSIRILGEGGYGRVYLARDDELGRPVAIKVPRANLLGSPENVQAFLSEARLAARLKHASIVTVHDVGRIEGIGPFIVMEYIEGQSLSALLREARPGPRRLAELLVQVADAVHHAHGAGLVHRDLKPGNILIDAAGVPHVADFGMAVTEDLQRLKSGEIAGTPQFMAPEQVRGETHRLDGRTDLWGLGVIFYLGLTGRLPFPGPGRGEVFDEILHRDPKPPRLIDSRVPRELERICLKCLAKRMVERYQVAADLADDLRTWLAARDPGTVASTRAASTSSVSPAAPRQPIVPKGLRSFGGEDADFFLTLLPGPRDRDGLPESIRFWKARIEEIDDEKTFHVGVIYGPSGCGKTSLVKAGLLPRLGKGVRTIYLEAAAAGTETRLLSLLRRHFPSLPDAWTLAESIAGLREGRLLPPGDKVLIVLDQFEQWLHAHPDDPEAELTRTLRQCDGCRVQGLILIRDDFWMSISRFMRALEVRLVEGKNSLAVELFDSLHARKVLAAFGGAWDRLPSDPSELSGEQARFLDRAIAELGKRHDGWIVPVRLSLFAEMVRGRPWVSATLKDVGGAEGIGVRFLDETFCGSSAHPEHRLHQGAARAVLRALLPDSSTDLKGAHRSGQELLEVAGYSRRSDEFPVLMRILDSELRLITPTEQADIGNEPGSARSSSAGGAGYQLAHDALVPSIRQWLSRKQRETRRGRAELRLVERSEFWNARPEPRHLVSFGEWLEILLWTRARDRTAPQRSMIWAATRRYLVVGLVAAVLLCALALGAGALRRRVEEEQKITQAEGLIAQLNVADIEAIPEIIAGFADYRPWVDRRLHEIAGDPRRSPQLRERANLALLPVDPTRARIVLDQGMFFAAEPQKLAVLSRLLHPYRRTLIDGLWTTAMAATAAGERPRLMRAAAALASFDPDGTKWPEIAPGVADQLVRENVLQVRAWSDLLWPARHHLLAGLGAVFRDPARPATERSIATEVLREYTVDDPPALVELIKDADAEQFAVLLPAVGRHRGAIIDAMRKELAIVVPGSEPEKSKERLARRQENAAIILLGNATPEPVWPLLKQSPDPRLRSQLVCNLSRRGALPQPLVARLGVEPDPSARRALLLALAGYPAEQLAPESRASVLEAADRMYRNDPDSGIHSAARCLLLRWGGSDRVGALDEELKTEGRRENRAWYVNPEGHTMIVVGQKLLMPGGAFTGGGDRPYAIASHEVTVAQLTRFDEDHAFQNVISPTPDCPANIVTWYDAAAYCRWLSEREQLPEDEMCYPPVEKIRSGMKLPRDYLERTGYRLPTKAEWTEACGAGARTKRFYGESDALMPWYAWTSETSISRMRPVGLLLPNDLGLFDMMGNANEWCQDGLTGTRDLGVDVDPLAPLPVLENQRRILKGGSITSRASSMYTAAHDAALPTILFNSVGFRVARTIRPQP